MGRASKQDWVVEKHVGKDFFETMEKWRRWSFSFREYYDVYIWDLEPGCSIANLHDVVMEMLYKAHRYADARDLYALSAPILETITVENESGRAVDVRPGDDRKTLFDIIHADDTRMVTTRSTGEKFNGLPPNWGYAEDDALEDAVLFPYDIPTEHDSLQGPLFLNEIQSLEKGMRSTLERFVVDPYSDLSDDSDIEFSEKSTTESKLSRTGADDVEQKDSQTVATLAKNGGVCPHLTSRLANLNGLPDLRELRLRGEVFDLAEHMCVGLDDAELDRFQREISSLAVWEDAEFLKFMKHNVETETDMSVEYNEFLDKSKAKGK